MQVHRDGSTDVGVIEEERVYLLFMVEQGKSEVKFLITESPEFTSGEGLKDAIKIAFSRIGMDGFSPSLNG